MSNGDSQTPPSGGEISEAALQELNSLLDNGPGEDASEEELNAFMARVLAIEGGGEMMKELAKEVSEGGLLEALFPGAQQNQNPLYLEPKSPLRIVFRVSLAGCQPEQWRRVSLAGDASFFDLHCALEDVFSWKAESDCRFVIGEGGQDLLTFGFGEPQEDEGLYCGFQNQVRSLYHEGVSLLKYLSGPDAINAVSITIEKLTSDDSAPNQVSVGPRLIDGSEEVKAACPDLGTFPFREARTVAAQF